MTTWEGEGVLSVAGSCDLGHVTCFIGPVTLYMHGGCGQW